MSQPTQPLQAIALSGSPSPNSRSRILLEHTLATLAAHGVVTHLLDLSELPADALLGRRRDDAIDAAIQQATGSNILILGTPVYRATYTGQLKAFLDLFPQAALRGRVVGLLATGATPLHGLAIDHGLRPLVASLSGLSTADGLYVTDAQFPDKTNLPPDLNQKLVGLAHELLTLAAALRTTHSV
ncbi:MAG: NAD(P)H-dependent oxidoreductase [Caldilineaceae bacterium]|jgi:FMN reductase